MTCSVSSRNRILKKWRKTWLMLFLKEIVCLYSYIDKYKTLDNAKFVLMGFLKWPIQLMEAIYIVISKEKQINWM